MEESVVEEVVEEQTASAETSQEAPVAETLVERLNTAIAGKDFYVTFKRVDYRLTSLMLEGEKIIATLVDEHAELGADGRYPLAAIHMTEITPAYVKRWLPRAEHLHELTDEELVARLKRGIEGQQFFVTFLCVEYLLSQLSVIDGKIMATLVDEHAEQPYPESAIHQMKITTAYVRRWLRRI